MSALRRSLAAVSAMLSLPVVAPPPQSLRKPGALASLGLFLMERDMVALPAGVARNASRSFRRKLLGSTAATAVPK